VFNVINRKALLEFCLKYPPAKTALLEWYHELRKSNFRSFNELKGEYGTASLVGDDRVCFNIMGNSYRLIVRIVFEFNVIQIKWFGTHDEYDRIDVKTVQYKKR